VTSIGYDRIVELVAENPALEAEELLSMATDEGFEATDARAGCRNLSRKTTCWSSPGSNGLCERGVRVRRVRPSSELRFHSIYSISCSSVKVQSNAPSPCGDDMTL